MNFEDMTIRQLISECEKMQKQLKAFENSISTMNTISEHNWFRHYQGCVNY